MKTVQLKSNIHEIVDRIQSEQLLQALYDFLKAREKSKPGALWKTLTEEHKQEVLVSYEESEDKCNLVEASKVFKKDEMKIFLTKRAVKNYRSIQRYISGEFGENVADAFEQKTIDFLDLLVDFPELGVVEVPGKQIRGFQLTRNTRIFLSNQRRTDHYPCVLRSKTRSQKKTSLNLPAPVYR